MMKTLTQIIEAESHGIEWREDLQHELDMIDRCIKDLQAMKQARRELAVEGDGPKGSRVMRVPWPQRPPC